MRKSTLTGFLAVFLFALPVWAQQAPVSSTSVDSKPGKATAVRTITASVVITAVNKATRELTIKTASGESFDVVAGPEVKNFDQLKAGDKIALDYVQALTMELRKPGTPSTHTDASSAVRAKEGEKPGGAVGRRVTVVAEVTDVNPDKKTITLKGPKGGVVELAVSNPEQFKVVKKGDSVEAEYMEALAVSVKPAP
jgi:hypothetical protein